MPIDFKYVPASGALSGKSFEEQTERAFNELGVGMDANSATASEALNLANSALSTSATALATAQNAESSANAVTELATTAMVAANAASQAAGNAQARADSAYDLATQADFKAQSAGTLASEAQQQAARANTMAEAARSAASTAQIQADSALAQANAAMGVFFEDDEQRDANEACNTPEKSFLTNTDPENPNLNFPPEISEPFWFSVFITDDGKNVLQECRSDATGLVYTRTGAVNVSDPGNPIATWNPWKIDDFSLLPYVLEAGENVFYVRPDGDNANDGRENTPAGAWRDPQYAAQWINMRRFIGTAANSHIRVYLADGIYTQSPDLPATLGVSSVQHVGAFDAYLVPRVGYPDLPGQFIGFVGNIDNPENVIFDRVAGSTSGFGLGGAVYAGITFLVDSDTVKKHHVISTNSSGDGEAHNINIVVRNGRSPSFIFAKTSPNSFVLSGTWNISFSNLNDVADAYNVQSIWVLTAGTIEFGVYGTDRNDKKMSRAYGSTVNISGEVKVASTWQSYNACRGQTRHGNAAGNGMPCTINGENVIGRRFSIQYPATFFSNGQGIHFFPGTVEGAAVIPASGWLN